MPLVIEGILTTEHEDGSLHFAPMGPVVNRDLGIWTIKPFQTSTTFRNLQRRPRAVFHVTDDCYMLAAAAIGVRPAVQSHWEPELGWVLDETCHWYAIEFQSWDVSESRAVASGKVVHQNVQRPFWGWNRGKHAVLEAAILATRKNILSRDAIAQEWEYLVVRVRKTGGDQEHRAMRLLSDFLELPYNESND